MKRERERCRCEDAHVWICAGVKMRRREDTQMMMMLLLLMVMMLLLMMMMMLLLMMMMVMVMIICSDNVVLMSLLLFKEEPFAQTLSRAKKTTRSALTSAPILLNKCGSTLYT